MAPFYGWGSTASRLEPLRGGSKHNKLLYSGKNKLDCIKMLISNSINDGIISHDEFLEILKEKKDYDSLKNEDKTETI